MNYLIKFESFTDRLLCAIISAARVVFIVTGVEALLFLKFSRLVQLPVLDHATMTEHLFEVAFEACVEGHHSVGIHLHVGNIASTSMLPSRLPRENQVHMIPAQDRCEYQEEEEKDDEDHEYCLDMVPLAPLDVD